MTLIDTIRADFDRRAANRRRIEVPEWGTAGAPAVIYARPVTLAERSRIARAAGEDQNKILVHGLVLKAEAEDGSRIFADEDVLTLLHKADADVVLRVATMLFRAETADPLGNSAAIPASAPE